MPKGLWIIAGLLLLLMWITAKGQNKNGGARDIIGKSEAGLHPSVTIFREGSEWHYEIAFVGETNFPDNAWLKPPTRLGGKLRLFLNNGIEIALTNESVNSVALPNISAVSNIIQMAPNEYRVRMWMAFGPGWGGKDVGREEPTANFPLSYLFQISATNDYTFVVTPLLYRVDTNSIARLVEFSPIKVRLLSTGKVDQLDINVNGESSPER